jgi:hypothetical protein
MSAYTEERAKTKLCPVMSAHGLQMFCLGSACALWKSTSTLSYKRRHAERQRWDAPAPAIGDKREPARPATIPADAVWSPGGFDGDEWIAVACWYESDVSLEGRQRILDAADADKINAGHCGLERGY